MVRPIILKPSPTSILKLIRHKKRIHNHIIVPRHRHLSTTHIPSHSHIQQHRHLPQRPRPLRHLSLHHRPAINIPNHASLASLSARLIPRKVIPNRSGMHIRYTRAQDAVLIRLMVLAPVQARMVLMVAVPSLCNIDFAICRPCERFLRQEPECRPDAVRTGRVYNAGENTAVLREGASADEPRRGVSLIWRVGMFIDNGSYNQPSIWRTVRNICPKSAKPFPPDS